jgi:predicted nuclease with RNAse H fold
VIHAVGVDVGGPVKGFHACFLEDLEVVRWFACVSHLELAEEIREFAPAVVAIDAPRFALRQRGESREAERAIFRRGYRLQWTRQTPNEPDSWMVNGAALWAELDGIRCVETFPTAASDRLGGSPVLLPLGMLAGKEVRAGYKDYLDAAICAWVAHRVATGEAEAFGMDDEMGAIWV